MTPRQFGRIKAAITRLENAVHDKAFQGTIPVGESDEATAAYEAIDIELERARTCLLDLIQRSAR